MTDHDDDACMMCQISEKRTCLDISKSLVCTSTLHLLICSIIEAVSVASLLLMCNICVLHCAMRIPHACSLRRHGDPEQMTSDEMQDSHE